MTRFGFPSLKGTLLIYSAPTFAKRLFAKYNNEYRIQDLQKLSEICRQQSLKLLKIQGEKWMKN